MTIDIRSTLHRFRGLLAVALLSIGTAACDPEPEPSRDDQPRASCNLEDEGCASPSELEAVSGLLDSRSVDLETTNVELRFSEASEPDVSTDAASGASARASAADALTSRPDVQEGVGCFDDGVWACCCYVGPWHGCECWEL